MLSGGGRSETAPSAFAYPAPPPPPTLASGSRGEETESLPPRPKAVWGEWFGRQAEAKGVLSGGGRSETAPSAFAYPAPPPPPTLASGSRGEETESLPPRPKAVWGEWFGRQAEAKGVLSGGDAPKPPPSAFAYPAPPPPPTLASGSRGRKPSLSLLGRRPFGGSGSADRPKRRGCFQGVDAPKPPPLLSPTRRRHLPQHSPPAPEGRRHGSSWPISSASRLHTVRVLRDHWRMSTYVRVVTDSAADLPPELIAYPEFGLFHSRSGLETSTSPTASLSIRPGSGLASVRQPFCRRPLPRRLISSNREIKEAERDGAPGCVIVCMSAAVSAAYQSAVLAAERLVSGIPGQGRGLGDAIDGAGIRGAGGCGASLRGAGTHDVATAAKEVASHTNVLAALDTLEFLERGGRIGSAGRFLGNLLDVKPLLTLENGVVAAAGTSFAHAGPPSTPSQNTYSDCRRSGTCRSFTEAQTTWITWSTRLRRESTVTASSSHSWAL